MKDYEGCVVEEGLDDNRVINQLEVVGVYITSSDIPEKRWHLYTVRVDMPAIELLSRSVKKGKWYIHFWKGREVVVVYRDKIFKFNYDNKATWKDAVEYGLSIDIPLKQLDFLID